MIKNWSAPITVKGIQSFLGFCNFYRRFIQEYGRIAKPLLRLTRKEVVWKVLMSEALRAFEQLKEYLITAPVLSHYYMDRETMLETDASDGVVAAVASQLAPDGHWYPFAYFSKTMAPAEYNYEIHDKEMLVIIRAFEQWYTELTAVYPKIQVYSDYHALEYFMTKRHLMARQARWLELLSEFDFKLMY